MAGTPEKRWRAILGMFGLAMTQFANANPPATLDDVAFLAGCWEGSAGDDGLIRETYTAPRAGTMLGNSQMVRGERTEFFEFIQLVQTADGVVYRPMPNARNAASFSLVAASDRHDAVFENAANDFPQRIAYRYDGARTLLVRIEMLSGDKRQSFAMQAVPCDGEVHRKALR